MASTEPFAGKVIAITGAASGIGKATAFYLAARGGSLALADRNEKLLEEVANDIRTETPRVKLTTKGLDVRSRNDIQVWIKSTVSTFGKLDGAANLAGVAFKDRETSILETDEDQWNFILDINLKGTFFCMQAELEVMNKGSSVVNVASIAALKGFVNNGAYSASKSGVIGLTRVAARELGTKEIRINVICP